MLETPRVLGSPENAPEIENKNAPEIENESAPEPEVYMQTHNSCKYQARLMINFCFDFSPRPWWGGDQGQRPDHESLFIIFLANLILTF